MFFDELSNDEWALLAALVSDEPAVRLNRRGRPRAEPRIVANAVLWILTTGEPWSKLPGRYPSGPTCRRRFEEWQLNGTLLEMVRLLSQTGRTLAYVPQPVPAVAAKPAAPVAVTPHMRDESLRGVSWKSPESWQAPGMASGLSSWRSADPFADMTRQLSGDSLNVQNAAPSASRREFGTGVPHHTLPIARPIVPPRIERSYAIDANQTNEAGAVGVAMIELDAAIASARGEQLASGETRSPLSLSLARRGAQVDDPRGYVIYMAAEQVPNSMYRAWAEIMKDGRRIERSGLVGPRFDNPQSAERFALDWAEQWIDRECRSLAATAALEVAAETASVTAAAALEHAAATAAATAATEVAELMEAGQAIAASYASAPVARPMPSLRHVPEPVAANHSAPLQGPLNGFRGSMRRYPGEPAATTAAGEGSASDRYPSYKELISHVG
jgi:transposase